MTRAEPHASPSASRSPLRAADAQAPRPAALGGMPAVLPDANAVMDRAGGENFPVALRILRRREREQLLAIYGFARLVDELGDELRGDRLAALEWLEGELDRAFAGASTDAGAAGRARTGDISHPLMRRLQLTLAERPLSREPFERLIEANRMDQRTHRYESFEQLCSYCELSANPVGRLVLEVFGVSSPERISRSDQVCTALQLAEHWQDVAEDYRRGRIYIPAVDLDRFGIGERELLSEDPEQRQRMRRLIAFEVARARELLAAGAPLIDMLHGRPRLAVAGFVAGGESALDAIERAGHEVLRGPPRAGRLRRLVTFISLLARRRV